MGKNVNAFVSDEVFNELQHRKSTIPRFSISEFVRKAVEEAIENDSISRENAPPEDGSKDGAISQRTE
jgi:DNA topoisomerase IA